VDAFLQLEVFTRPASLLAARANVMLEVIIVAASFSVFANDI
jgi:hypothetical protein